MNWRDVETAAKRDPRSVLPISSTEQHGLLSLCVDAILAEKVAVEAAEPLDVPVFPVIPYGHAPYFAPIPAPLPCDSRRCWRWFAIWWRRFIIQDSGIF